MNIEKFGYKILEDGRVLGKRTGKPMKFCDNGKGYMISAISVEGRRVPISQHIVVAYKFLGKCPEGMEVDHIDTVRDNNHPDNLRYLSKSENNTRSYSTGNRDVSGTNNANSKVSEEQVRYVCNEFATKGKQNLSKMSRDTGIARMTLSMIWHRKQWTGTSSSYKY